MDHVSDLADKSNAFASFLAAARILKCNCVCIFHAIFPEKSIWRLIRLKTNILNVFPASVPILNVSKIFQTNNKNIYLNIHGGLIVFVEFANKNERISLTINCSGINLNDPGKTNLLFQCSK